MYNSGNQLGENNMKKYSNFIFFLVLILFLGLFTTFVQKEEVQKKGTETVKKIKELELKETEIGNAL